MNQTHDNRCSCEELAALLDPYVDGELTTEEALLVQEHLSTCESCRDYVDSALAIRAAFPGAEETEVPEGFAESVMRAIQASEPSQRKRRERRLHPWARTALPLAACCAIVILLARGPLSANRGTAGNPAPQAPMEAAADTAEDACADDAENRFSTSAGADLAEDKELPADADKDILADTGTALTAAPSTVEDAVREAESPAVPYAMAGMEGTGEENGADLPATATAVPEPQNGEAADDGTMGSAEEQAPAAAVRAVGGSASLAAPSENPSEEVEKSDEEVPAASLEEEDWVEYGNVVFACVVHLDRETAGDALDGYEGRPYRTADGSEDAGTGYALEAEDFERILGELGYPLPPLRQERTTELRCIVVTEP